ncbi:DUF1570 domain-containing protein [Tsuneonella sp. YG55]|uniref:DUF1570 domain-containing protein n=1 Tax=Tsuneonella litorea TaxID=2976475 RepID=A0A9X3ANT0_9SPHN|nr:DUF1570 domain-containing protein [Tsuneonella litorea]MCT2560132.1 DUF1570 domain-containing protein [Tsuneonella litorea]
MAAVIATPAHANWRVAETEHFIYYSEAPADELVETVSRMETFDTLVRALTGNTRPASPVKVTMFEVADMDEVNATFPYPMQGVGGYYNSTADGPFLVTFRNVLRAGRNSAKKASRQSYDWGPEVRQHEYLHHYMYQYFNANYPSWYSEGFAEYYGTMAFPETNVVEIGHAPYFRIDTIRGNSWLPTRKLLTAKSYSDVGDDIGQLYAQGWLLTHLGAQNKERGAQLQRYLKAVATGVPYEKAATDSFGDLDALDKELRQHKSNIQAMRLSLKPMDFGEIPVRELNDMESQLMRYRIRLYSGYPVSALPKIISAVADIRKAAPENVMGLEIQSQLENLAGRHAAALETAEHLLRVDPNNVIGLTEKGEALVGQLARGASEDQLTAAREPLHRAIALSAVATAPRVALFKSFLQQGALPSLVAQNHMVEAFQLLPQNEEIRYLLARDFENRGLVDDAIAIIEPAAYGAFDGDEKEKKRRGKLVATYAEKYTNIDNYETPRDMLDRLEAKKDGRFDEKTGAITPKPQPAEVTAS